QQLTVQQIQHERTDPLAVLYRSGHPVGDCRPRLGAADDAAAVMCAVLGDDQWRRFGEIEYLPGDMACRHSCGQRFTARRARFWIMVDGGIRIFSPAKRRARMALLTAGFLA